MRISDWSSDVCSSDLNRNHLQVNPGSIAQELPGHDVGVVLHLGDHHLVARLQLAAIAVGYEVDGLGDVAGEHDLLVGAGVEEARHRRAHAFVAVGEVLAEVVRTSVYVDRKSTRLKSSH